MSHEHVVRRAVRKRFFRQDAPEVLCCAHCHSRLTKPAADVDHIRPVSLGGGIRSPRNLQTLCKRCHKAKCLDENRVQYELRHGGRRIRWLRWLARKWGAGAGS